MVLPLIAAAGIGAGAQIVSSIMSWMESKDAANATAAERQKMQDLVNSIQQPNFDLNSIKPEEFKLIQAYVPAAVPLIEENAPQVVKNTKDMNESRGAQLESLRYMRQLAAQGKDPIAEMDRLRGSRQAAQEAGTQMQNIQSQMQRRGIGDSGLSLGLQQQAAGDAGYRTAMAGEQAAADALNRRGTASMNAANIGNQVFGADESIESKNASIINDFNQRMSQRRQQLAQLNVGNANQAAQDYQNQMQNVNNKNVDLRNNTALNEQQRQNQLKQNAYNNSMQKANVLAGQSAQNVGDIQNNANTNQKLYAGAGKIAAGAAMGIADDTEEEKKKKAAQQLGYIS